MRVIVRSVAVFVLPALVSISGFFIATRILHLTSASGISLAALAFFAFSAAASLESSIYVRELRSVAPRPIAAAISFLARLGILFSATGAVFLAALACGNFFGHPILGLIFAPFLALFSYAALSWWLLAPRIDLVRGRVFRAYREVWFKSLEHLRSSDRIFFGGIWIPWASAVKHFLVLGATGSGKTMVFDLLAQSTLRGRLGRGLDQRGLWFDAKTEALPRLAALGVPYKILNPFDRRSVALDIKSMVPTRAAAMELASILMPQMKGTTSDPFWVDSPRNILASTLTSLRLGVPRANGDRQPIDWDLRDVVLLMGSMERIREVMTRHPETRDDLDGYFDDGKLSASLLATIKTAMMWYRPIAACWHRAEEKINLDDSVSGAEEYMLVLGNREESRMAINAINRAIVTRYAQLALARGNSKTRRIWFFLDEFPDLRRIDPDAMKGLLTKGRSRGACVVIGVQTLSSVANEYGPEDANTILSQCQNIAVLGLGDLDSESAECVMRGIGQSERHEYLDSQTQGLSLKRTTRTQLQSRPVVLSSELADLPETSKANGLPGYYRTRSTRGWWGAVIPGKFLEKTLTRPAEDVPDIEERPLLEHELEPWDDADLERLGLSKEPVETPKIEDEARAAKKFRVYRGGKPERLAS